MRRVAEKTKAEQGPAKEKTCHVTKCLAGCVSECGIAEHTHLPGRKLEPSEQLRVTSQAIRNAVGKSADEAVHEIESKEDVPLENNWLSADIIARYEKLCGQPPQDEDDAESDNGHNVNPRARNVELDAQREQAEAAAVRRRHYEFMVEQEALRNAREQEFRRNFFAPERERERALREGKHEEALPLPDSGDDDEDSSSLSPEDHLPDPGSGWNQGPDEGFMGDDDEDTPLLVHAPPPLPDVRPPPVPLGRNPFFRWGTQQRGVEEAHYMSADWFAERAIEADAEASWKKKRAMVEGALELGRSHFTEMDEDFVPGEVDVGVHSHGLLTAPAGVTSPVKTETIVVTPPPLPSTAPPVYLSRAILLKKRPTTTSHSVGYPLQRVGVFINGYDDVQSVESSWFREVFSFFYQRTKSQRRWTTNRYGTPRKNQVLDSFVANSAEDERTIAKYEKWKWLEKLGSMGKGCSVPEYQAWRLKVAGKSVVTSNENAILTRLYTQMFKTLINVQLLEYLVTHNDITTRPALDEKMNVVPTLVAKLVSVAATHKDHILHRVDGRIFLDTILYASNQCVLTWGKMHLLRSCGNIKVPKGTEAPCQTPPSGLEPRGLGVLLKRR